MPDAIGADRHEYRLQYEPTGRLVTVVTDGALYVRPGKGWGEAIRWQEHYVEVLARLAGQPSPFAIVWGSPVDV